MKRPLWATVALAVAMAGCGGKAAPSSPPPPPETPRHQPAPAGYGQPAGAPTKKSPGESESPSPTAAPQPFAQPPPPASPMLPGWPGADPAPTLAMALVQLAASEQALDLTLTACADACKALASMERAARQVCALEEGSERPRCDDARARLRRARERVRTACGSCPNGPSTDPEAPP